MWLRRWRNEVESTVAKLEALVDEAGDETGARGREFFALRSAVTSLRTDLLSWADREGSTQRQQPRVPSDA
jgi:hypothetical protein